MFRIVVIAVAASAAYDLYFLDGKYTNAIQARLLPFCITSSGFGLLL